ncbi:MAG: hypothetical protein KDK12_20530 [Rhodobacteraceae bacterium]|nr:hypothetical protein [Paracoccaceae bacterium]
MQTEPAYLIHYLIGALTLLCWWGAFLSAKGSPRHRAFGRAFLVLLSGALLTVGLIFFASSRDFAPPEVIQFTYLVLCVVTVGGTAFAAIRLRRDPERFRGPLFRTFGIAAFLMGGVVLAAGLATGAVMPVIFSVIGLLYGGAMIRFAWFRGPLHPRWWLGWHLNGMCFLFNAVHGTLLAVLWRVLVAPDSGTEVIATTQLGTMAVSLALRLWFGRRFDAPLRFGVLPRAAQPA